LTPDEIERLIQEAVGYAESDRGTKEKVVLRNKLDSLLRNTQKSFTRFGGLLSQNDQDIATRVFEESEAAVNSDNLDDINRALNGLGRVASQLTTAMMNPANNASQGAEEPV
jgi:molecular chaperone DnaK